MPPLGVTTQSPVELETKEKHACQQEINLRNEMNHQNNSVNVGVKIQAD